MKNALLVEKLEKFGVMKTASSVRNVLTLSLLGVIELSIMVEDFSRKHYARFTNGVVCIDDVQAFTWSKLKPSDDLTKFIYPATKSGDVYKIVIFLKGGQNFITATSPKNLKKVINRFKEQKTLLGEDELWEEE